MNTVPGAHQSLTTPNYGRPEHVNTSGKKIIPGVTASLPKQGPKYDLERLTREKAELMDSGAYTEDDPLIQEMDRQIAACQAKLSLLAQ